MARTKGARLVAQPEDINRKQRIATAIEMRLQEFSEAQIAAQVGVDQSTVSRWLKKAFAERHAAGVDELRAIEGARYERLAHRLQRKWETTDDERIAAVLTRVYERRARLYGLDKANAPAPPLHVTGLIAVAPEARHSAVVQAAYRAFVDTVHALAPDAFVVIQEVHPAWAAGFPDIPHVGLAPERRPVVVDGKVIGEAPAPEPTGI